MAIGEIIQIHNRTERTLNAMKGGRSYPIPPGRSYMTRDVLRYARQQNPVPGTENTQTGEYESLISIVFPEGSNDQKRRQKYHPLDTIPEDVLIPLLQGERIDRSTLTPDRQGGVEMKTPFPVGRVGVEVPTGGMTDPEGAGFGRGGS